MELPKRHPPDTDRNRKSLNTLPGTTAVLMNLPRGCGQQLPERTCTWASGTRLREHMLRHAVTLPADGISRRLHEKRKLTACHGMVRRAHQKHADASGGVRVSRIRRQFVRHNVAMGGIDFAPNQCRDTHALPTQGPHAVRGTQFELFAATNWKHHVYS